MAEINSLVFTVGLEGDSSLAKRKVSREREKNIRCSYTQIYIDRYCRPIKFQRNREILQANVHVGANQCIF